MDKLRTIGLGLIVTLTMTGCAASVHLTGDFLNEQQVKDNAYLTARSVNGAFRTSFYELRDSSFAAVHPDTATLHNLVYIVDAERLLDSLNARPLSYWKHLRDILEVNYSTARSTIK